MIRTYTVSVPNQLLRRFATFISSFLSADDVVSINESDIEFLMDAVHTKGTGFQKVQSE